MANMLKKAMQINTVLPIGRSEYMAFFFIIYLLVVGFFVVNMFVGVIIDNFHKCREAQMEEEKERKKDKKLKNQEKEIIRKFVRIFNFLPT